MSCAAEAELGSLYINAREAILQRHLLHECGHPQQPTPIQIDNSMALGVVTNTIQPKCTKAMGMHFHWLRCHENQKQFCRHWRTGATNLAGYITKHFPAINHQSMHSVYLTQPTKLHNLCHKVQEIIHIANLLSLPTPTACTA
jgi:hypothetical protein